MPEKITENTGGEKKPNLNEETSNEMLLKKINELESRLSGSNNNAPKAISQEEMMSTVVAAVTKANKTNTDTVIDGYFDPANIDKNDHLETPVRFVAYLSGYVIVDDLRQGKAVRTPYNNVIVFKYDSSVAVKTGKEHDVTHYATYFCESKKESEWLKAHSEYGFMFYDHLDSNIQAGGKRAMRLASAMRNIKTLNQHQLIRVCKDSDIPVGETSYMRAAIAEFQVEKVLKEEKQNSKQMLQETEIEKALFPDN